MPENPEIRLDAECNDPETLVEQVLTMLIERGMISRNGIC